MVVDSPHPDHTDLLVTRREVFPGDARPDEPFIRLTDWSMPITFLVGRNGTGKSKTARVLAQKSNGRLLATDRLVGLMAFTHYGWTSVPAPDQQRGMPLGQQEREQAKGFAATHGTATEELYALREQPEVWLRVAAFIRRALGRVVELRERSGFLDPYIRVGDIEFSLLRDEGHGLRELVVLLAGTYRRDWPILVVDEPELHLHPSLARLWLFELEKECKSSGRHAIIVTHEPSLVRPRSASDLAAIWHFSPDLDPSRISNHVLDVQQDRVDASIEQNPDLVSQLVFAPRPVLVEGKHDIAALTVALSRTRPPEAVAQTDLVDCGGTGGVALWFEIARKLGLDFRAIADLDAMFEQSVHRSMDASQPVLDRYRTELKIEPARTANALRPLLETMGREGVAANPRSRAEWLLTLPDDGNALRRDALIEIWREAGLWLHPEGRLEQVLGIEGKSVEAARTAAAVPGPIEKVAEWSSFTLDPRGEVQTLLNAAVERIAHQIMEALRLQTDAAFTSPVGAASESDSRLVDVAFVGGGVHRITVKTPDDFTGWWLEFSRETPSAGLLLQPPDVTAGPP